MNLRLVLLPVILLSTCCSGEYFWQLTDFHADPTYFTGQKSCNSPPPAAPGKFGDYDCDSPWTLVDSAVWFMTEELKQGKTPQFILWTGDNGFHALDHSDINTDQIVAIIQNITNVIQVAFDNVTNSHPPVYSVLGNHDYFPDNQLPDQPNQVYEQTWNMWNKWINDAEFNSEDTYKRAGYYTVKLPIANSNIRIVALNTNLNAQTNEAPTNKADPGGQFAWFDTVMTQAAANNEKVHVEMHIPPGYIGTDKGVHWLKAEYNTRLVQLLRKHAGSIIGVYSAHEHVDSFKIVYDDAGQPVVPIFLAPSLSPWRARLAPGVKTPAHNPGMRLYQYSPSQGFVEEITQYYLDLPRANTDGVPRWKVLYRFGASYGTNGKIDAAALNSVVNKFRAFANDDFHQFYDYVTLGARESSNQPCSCDCKEAFLCSMTNLEATPYNSCIQSITTCGVQALHTSTFFWVVLLILTFFVQNL